MDKKVMKRREHELLDNVVLRVEPTDEKGQMVCVDSSDKPRIGSRLEFVSVYRIYLVNNSDHDIEIVKITAVCTQRTVFFFMKSVTTPVRPRRLF